MTSSRKDSQMSLVDQLVQRSVPFALFRLPGEEHCSLITGTADHLDLMYDVKELNGRQGFVIAPFRPDSLHPVVLIASGSEERRLPVADVFPVGSEVLPDDWEAEVPTPCSEEYAGRFHSFVQALHSHRFDKLVLSRRLLVELPEAFSPAAAFGSACRRYIHSYVYLCHTPHTGTWLGSTPELILSGSGEAWHTVALAGTQPLQDGKLPQVWDAKNREEQAYVSAYIRSRLLSMGIHAQESLPYSAYAGALAHLKTDFRFSLQERGQLGELLELLHPTPAVCGLPKEEAYRFILENEGYERGYYSGFIGRIDPEGETRLYVNLRCMQIGTHALALYAGGGLLTSSNLQDEWQETERKLQTMRRILQPATVVSQDTYLHP